MARLARANISGTPAPDYGADYGEDYGRITVTVTETASQIVRFPPAYSL